MKVFRKSFIVWLVIIVGAYLAYSLISRSMSNSTPEVSYSDLVYLIEQESEQDGGGEGKDQTVDIDQKWVPDQLIEVRV